MSADRSLDSAPVGIAMLFLRLLKTWIKPIHPTHPHILSSTPWTGFGKYPQTIPFHFSHWSIFFNSPSFVVSLRRPTFEFLFNTNFLQRYDVSSKKQKALVVFLSDMTSESVSHFIINWSLFSHSDPQSLPVLPVFKLDWIGQAQIPPRGLLNEIISVTYFTCHSQFTSCFQILSSSFFFTLTSTQYSNRIKE